MRHAIVLTLCVLAACGHSNSNRTNSTTPLLAINDTFIAGVMSAPVGSAVDTGYGDIAFDLRASDEQIAAGTNYVLRYMQHWFPYAQHGLHVQVVQDGSLFCNGAPNRGVRDNDTGNVIVTQSATTNEIYASEWEIPMCVQQALDPPVWNSWTWSLYGPLYPGQDSFWVAVTNQ